jgi:hypothetical protein
MTCASPARTHLTQSFSFAYSAKRIKLRLNQLKQLPKWSQAGGKYDEKVQAIPSQKRHALS